MSLRIKIFVALIVLLVGLPVGLSIYLNTGNTRALVSGWVESKTGFGTNVQSEGVKNDDILKKGYSVFDVNEDLVNELQQDLGSYLWQKKQYGEDDDRVQRQRRKLMQKTLIHQS